MGYNNRDRRPVEWYRSARRHRIGKAHALYVMATVEPERVSAVEGTDPRLRWIGPDDRGIALEVAALDLPDEVIVIHVMPTALRRPS